MKYRFFNFFTLVLVAAFFAFDVYAGNSASIVATPPKSLCEYLDIDGIERLPRNVRDSIIAKKVVEQKQWWYKKAVMKHDSPVSSVAYNSQGTLLATTSNDKNVYLMDTDTQKVQILEHELEVCDARFNKQGTMLATASLSKRACLWNMRGHELYTLVHNDGFPDDQIRSVTFNDQGTLLGTVTEDGMVSVWNTQGDFLNNSFCGSTKNQSDRYLQKLIFHPQLPLLLIAGHAFSNGRLTSIEALNLRVENNTLLAHSTYVLDAAFNPKGTLIATASEDTTACLWNLKCEKLCTLPHSLAVRQVKFNPQGTMIATASGNCTSLWDCDGNKLHELYDRIRMYKLSFNFLGTALATADDEDNGVSLWNMNGQKVKKLNHHKKVRALEFSPHQMAIAVRSGNYACIWQQAEPTLPQLLLRIALQDYSRMCLLKREPLSRGLTSQELLKDAELKLNLKKDELTCIWHDLPRALQASILRTVIYRSKLHTNSVEYKEGWFGTYAVQDEDNE